MCATADSMSTVNDLLYMAHRLVDPCGGSAQGTAAAFAHEPLDHYGISVAMQRKNHEDDSEDGAHSYDGWITPENFATNRGLPDPLRSTHVAGRDRHQKYAPGNAWISPISSSADRIKRANLTIAVLQQGIARQVFHVPEAQESKYCKLANAYRERMTVVLAARVIRKELRDDDGTFDVRYSEGVETARMVLSKPEDRKAQRARRILDARNSTQRRGDLETAKQYDRDKQEQLQSKDRSSDITYAIVDLGAVLGAGEVTGETPLAVRVLVEGERAYHRLVPASNQSLERPPEYIRLSQVIAGCAVPRSEPNKRHFATWLIDLAWDEQVVSEEKKRLRIAKAAAHDEGS